MRGLVRAVLRLIGKGDAKVAAVFADSAQASRAAVHHLRRGAPGVPVWLFAVAPPAPEVAALCERVVIHRNSLVLFLRGWLLLWPKWVAISAAPWTGTRGRWPLKLAPFCIPPCKALLFNAQGDFFGATPPAVAAHNARNLHDAGLAAWGLVRAALRYIRDRLADLAYQLASLGQSAWLMFLLAAGRILKLLGHPPHTLFPLFHGAGYLDFPSTDSGDVGVVVFEQTGSIWDGNEFERFARNSSARWILWREEPVPAETFRDTLPLYRQENTFALSVQRHYRAWSPMLLPVAPFRALQPGEASQVFAPISTAILVDRHKLLALGIPRTSLPGVAWRILFWKAAAAGWRSYSVGAGGSLTEQPDAPIQETGFLFHLLRNPGLRRLGPREPDLSRGATSFATVPLGPAHLPGRLRVLLVSPFLPFPLSHGGAVRIWNLCRQLSDRVEFTLVAVREKDEHVAYDRLRDVFADIHVVDIDEPASLDTSLPGQVRQYRSRALRALLTDLAARLRPDLVQFEYTHMAAFRDAVPGVPAILVEHDLTFSLYSQLAQSQPGAEASAEYRRWLAFERRWLGAYDGVWTVSEEDRAIAVAESGRSEEFTFNIPNGVDIARFYPAPEPQGTPEILYVGSFRHLPNVLGLERLLAEVMPRVWSRLPHVRLRVVGGPRHESYWQRPSGLDPRVEIHGFVDDIRPLYERAAVVAVPLEVSAGTNIKVLEAMASGRPVVTTPIGCAGLGLRDGIDAIIRAEWPGFAGAVCDLLGNAGLRSSIASAARVAAETRFSWKAIAGDAYRSYLALIPEGRGGSAGTPSRVAQPQPVVDVPHSRRRLRKVPG